ncbi:MAG TPA: hypothetical protein VF258_07420 [Luteolibacter sp.]
MRLDTVTAEIRPRSDWEAVDLGFAMVRRGFWRCITVWWLAMGVPVAIATVLLWDRPMLLLALFWWAKPAGSRMVLFELSRRLFGEEPSWKSVWREIPRAWWRRFFYRFLWARFSPWLPVTLAVEDLEGLRGKVYKQRCGQVIRRGEGAVMWIFFISDAAAAWCGLGLMALLVMFMPEGQDGPWRQAIEAWDPNFAWEIPLLISRTVVGCVMAAMSLTDVFVIGAGFGIYVNNRTWIEGWDVELAFKRLAQRLGKVAAVVMVFFMLGLSLQGAGTPMDAEAEVDEQIETQRPPAEVIREVKADPAFKVHTVTHRVPKTKSSSGGIFPLGLLEILGKLFAVCAVALLVGFLGWMLWKYRHVFAMRSGGVKEEKIAPSARVVMGMEISPDTLPEDVPSAAWVLWQQGRHQEALGLLYRGSISRVMESGRVEIQESDTEGDCMRRVEQAGTAAHPDYFRGITGMWIRMAYAGISPADSEVRVVCEQWPFGGRRVP